MHLKTLFLTLFVAFGPAALLAGPSPSTADTMLYTVKSGDCLWNISRKVLKDSHRWPLIYTANEDRIRNPNLIYPGQAFAIPPPSAITKAGLKEAARIAYAKLAPITAHRTGRSATVRHVARDSSPPMASAPSQVQKAVPPPSTQAAPVAVAVSQSNFGMVALMVVIFLLVVALAFVIWGKMRLPISPQADGRDLAVPSQGAGVNEGPKMGSARLSVNSVEQAPRPLSSFPEVRNVEPIRYTPVEKQPTGTTGSPQTGVETKEEPPMRSGIITSVSMPGEPVAPPSEAKAPETKPQEPPQDKKPEDPTSSDPSHHAA